jgi:hypothetical protein
LPLSDVGHPRNHRIDQALEARRHAYEGMGAVLSDDHNYELGPVRTEGRHRPGRRAAPQRRSGRAAFEFALKLADALERVACDQGLAAVELVEVWFAD